MTDFKEYAKAFVAAATAGLTYLIGVLAPNAAAGDITFVQWLGLALAVLGTGGIVAVVPNKLTDAQKDKAVDEVLQEQRDAEGNGEVYIPKH